MARLVQAVIELDQRFAGVSFCIFHGFKPAVFMPFVQRDRRGIFRQCVGQSSHNQPGLL